MIKSVFEVLRVEEYDAQMKAAWPREIKTADCAPDECVFVLIISAQSASHFYLVLSNFPFLKLPPSRSVKVWLHSLLQSLTYSVSFLPLTNLRFHWYIFSLD